MEMVTGRMGPKNTGTYKTKLINMWKMPNIYKKCVKPHIPNEGNITSSWKYPGNLVPTVFAKSNFTTALVFLRWRQDKIKIQNFPGRHTKWSMVSTETEVLNSCSHSKQLQFL